MASSTTKPKLDVDTYLTTALSSTPASLHAYFSAFQDLHTRKLWHQLTLKLLEFVAEPDARPYRVDVVRVFVRDFEERINPLRLVELAAAVAEDIDNPAAHITFLTDLLARVPADTAPEAHIQLLSTLAHARLSFGAPDDCAADLRAAQAVLDGLPRAAPPAVAGAYYRVAADYHKARAEYAPYYRHSLLFLACVDVGEMGAEERVGRAHDLGVAALLGDTIYNFGELLLHPILDALEGTPHAWIKTLLFTFNEGNIGKFEALAPVFPQEPILQENFAFLRQKICLMALIESVFRRPAAQRVLPFAAIAEETRLAKDDVEHLLMKALALRLIRGEIDQVGGTARISWVQPRVLSRAQVGTLAKRLSEWGSKLAGVEARVAPGVLAGA